jgi:hypothetical protein
MSEKSDRARTSAKRMINSSGKTVTYILVNPGVYNTTTGRTEVVKTSKVIKATVVGAKETTTDEHNRIHADRYVYVAALDITGPSSGDRIVMDLEEWAVVCVWTTFVEDAPTIYKMWVRQT